MKMLIILTSLLWVGCINEPCPEELVQVYVKQKYISVGNYETSQPYNTYEECAKDITPNNGKPHYCQSEYVMTEVCK